MAFKTLMVRLSVENDETGPALAAGRLAEKLNASLIGIAAYPMLPRHLQGPMTYYGNTIPMNIIEEEYIDKVQRLLVDRERRFRAEAGTGAREVSWISAITEKPMAVYFVEESCTADIFITTPISATAAKDPSNAMNVGDIIMNIGRPVLLVPRGTDDIVLDTVLVGWKDTRASRRALSDSLPLLALAKQVVLAEIAAPDRLDEVENKLMDIARWLSRHGIEARTVAKPAVGSDTNQLAKLVEDIGATLMVAGAYGHSRFREWALGGVTSDLLLHSQVPTLLSH
jgi:nucleotide-binding universal stress UspA family protein